MKVAYFCDTFSPQINGVSMTLTRLSHYAHSHGLDTVFLVPSYPGTEKKDGNIFRFLSIPLFFYRQCRIVIPPVFKAEKILDDFKPDIIHAYSEFGISLAAIRYAKKHRIPIVSSYTSNFSAYLNYYNMQLLNPYLENYLNWFHNSCRLTFCPSESTRDYLYEKNIRRVELMRRGVDSSKFSPAYRSEAFRAAVGAGENSLVFTYVGRISPEKDLDILEQSVKMVKARYGDRATFVIVGDGPYLPHMKQSLQGLAHFTGFLTGAALSEAYASSDVFVFPSTTETFGNSVLEGMCSGLPAVVPRSGGVAEIVTDGYDGLVVPPRDSGEFTVAIMKYLQQPFLVGRMRSNALQTAHSRSWDTVFQKLFCCYEELLKA